MIIGIFNTCYTLTEEEKEVFVEGFLRRTKTVEWNPIEVSTKKEYKHWVIFKDEEELNQFLIAKNKEFESDIADEGNLKDNRFNILVSSGKILEWPSFKNVRNSKCEKKLELSEIISPADCSLKTFSEKLTAVDFKKLCDFLQLAAVINL